MIILLLVCSGMVPVVGLSVLQELKAYMYFLLIYISAVLVERLNGAKWSCSVQLIFTEISKQASKLLYPVFFFQYGSLSVSGSCNIPV